MVWLFDKPNASNNNNLSSVIIRCVSSKHILIRNFQQGCNCQCNMSKYGNGNIVITISIIKIMSIVTIIRIKCSDRIDLLDSETPRVSKDTYLIFTYNFEQFASAV